MKHGPIALIDAKMPVVVIATHSPIYEKVISNLEQVCARDGRVQGDLIRRPAPGAADGACRAARAL